MQPGQSWNSYYQTATCGEVINVAAGNHGTQRILENATLSQCSNNVVFKTLPGADVQMQEIWFASPGTPATDGADHVTVEGPLKAKGGVGCYGDCNFITIDKVDGGTVSLYVGPKHWVIKNSDWGPCWSSGPNYTAGNCQTTAPDDSQIEIVGSQNDDIQFIGNTIHDFDLVNEGVDHYECVRTDSGSNYLWRANKFYGCQIYGMTTHQWGGISYIENNWFGGGDYPNGTANGIAINAEPNLPTGAHIYVRFNSFSAQDTVNQDFGNGHTGWHFIGNIFGHGPAYGTQCFTGAEFKYNVYIGSQKCGDATNGANAGVPYVNGIRGPNMNYHLGTSTVADNYVPGSQPNSDLAMDFDEEVRTAPRDAGSDER